MAGSSKLPEEAAAAFARHAALQLAEVTGRLAAEHARLVGEREQSLLEELKALRSENEELRQHLAGGSVLPKLPPPPGAAPADPATVTGVEVEPSWVEPPLCEAVTVGSPVREARGSGELVVGASIAVGSPVCAGTPTSGISPLKNVAVGSPLRRQGASLRLGDSPSVSLNWSSPMRRRGVSPAPSNSWSSPTRRLMCRGGSNGEMFQLWPELLVRADEAHPPTIDFFPADDQSEFAIPISCVEDVEFTACTPWIMSPSAPARLMWEICGMPILGYDLAHMPLQVFSVSPSLFTDFMLWLTLLYWTLDLVATFFVGYYTKDGKLVMSFMNIVLHNLRFGFWLDLFVVSIDWFLICVGDSGDSALHTAGVARMSKFLRILRIFRVLRLLRLRKLRKIVHAIQDRVDSEYLSVVLNIIKNLLCVMMASHLVACLWYWIGTQVVEGYPSWVTSYGLADAEWQYSYLTSLHWSITQFTPGSMDVQPKNTLERGLAVILLLLAMMVFSIFVSSLTNSMISLQNIGSKHTRQLWLLRKFFRQNNISRDLSMRVTRYVNVVLVPQLERVQRSDVTILSSLSAPLCMELQTELHLPRLVVHPFFSEFSKKSFAVVCRLCRAAVEQISLSRGDVLFSAGRKATEMFFIAQGFLVYRLRSDASPDVVLTRGQWCSEAVLWCPWVHHGAMRAKIECMIVTMNAAKFREVVTEHIIDLSFLQLYCSAFVKALNEAARAAETSGCGHISDLQADLLGGETLQQILSA